MSNQAITWAYQQQGIKSGAKFILITLANYANDAGECFPGLNTLAKNCGMHRSSVVENIKRLEAAGLIEVIHRGGDGSGRKSNVYRLACSSNFLSRGEKHNGQSRESQLAKSKNSTQGLSRETRPAKSAFSQAKSGNRTGTLIEPPRDTSTDNDNRIEKADCPTEKQKQIQVLITTLADLQFKHAQVHSVKVLAMLKRWAEWGVASDDVIAVVMSIRRKYPGKDFGPAYLEKPINDYLEAKQHGNANSQRVGSYGHQQKSKSEQGEAIIKAAFRDCFSEIDHGLHGTDEGTIPGEVVGKSFDP